MTADPAGDAGPPRWEAPDLPGHDAAEAVEAETAQAVAPEDEVNGTAEAGETAAAAAAVAEAGEAEAAEAGERRRAIEAVLAVAVEPVPPRILAELLEAPVGQVTADCEALAAEYEAQRRGIVVARVAGGYRIQTHPDLAPYVERFANRGVSARLSTAALETLAIVAYRQPVSRAQIANLRGVNVDGVTRLLEQRGYIQAVGRAQGPGQPVLYGTTDLFLERLGLDNLGQLPPAEDLLPGPEVAGALEEQVLATSPTAEVDLQDELSDDGEAGGGPSHTAPGDPGAEADEPAADGSVPMGDPNHRE